MSLIDCGKINTFEVEKFIVRKMILHFIAFRFLDFVDIFLVALLLYQLYKLIQGSVAINIFVAVVAFWLLWLLVKALNMQLLTTILGQFIGVGMIVLVIVFQQEIRRFLLIVGSRYIKRRFAFEKFFKSGEKTVSTVSIRSIVQSCINLSQKKIGALIVYSYKNDLTMYAQTGEIIDARLSERLIESLFFKNSALHDGAVLIVGDRIKAAGCLLPISHSNDLNPQYGMRHRAALGMAEETGAFVIIVSEETGNVAYCFHGELKELYQIDDLFAELEKYIREQ